MHRITESITIQRPIKKVFAFLREVEPRLRLNPFYSVLGFEKLTKGETGVGMRFRIVLLSNGKRNEYESEIIEYVENERIASRDSKGRLRLTLMVKEIPEGTLLTHEEEFVIPPELLYPEEEGHDEPFWLKLFRGLVAIERARFTDRDRDEKIEEIKDNLRNNLRAWLRKIKEALEAG